MNTFVYSGKEGAVVVAVKTLKESAGEKERKDLVQELEVMKTLEPHPNIVRLLGCCTEKGRLPNIGGKCKIEHSIKISLNFFQIHFL